MKVIKTVETVSYVCDVCKEPAHNTCKICNGDFCNIHMDSYPYCDTCMEKGEIVVQIDDNEGLGPTNVRTTIGNVPLRTTVPWEHWMLLQSNLYIGKKIKISIQVIE